MKMTIRPVALLLALSVGLVLAACDRAPGSSAASVTTPKAQPELNAGIDWVRVDFSVQGMDCAGCVIGTRAALKRLDGVKEAGASFGSLEASTAWAVYDPARVTPERMMAAIRELGYTPAISPEGAQ